MGVGNIKIYETKRYMKTDEIYSSYLKNNIIEDIKSNPTLLVDIAKWGILYQ